MGEEKIAPERLHSSKYSERDEEENKSQKHLIVSVDEEKD
jgi:hypothetical protein